MLSFDILEVAISTYLQLYRSSIVTNDNALFVHLQGTDCPHLHDRAFYCMIQRTSFVMTVYDNHHLSCTEHSTHAYCQRCLRHFVYVIIKETGISNNSVGSQCLLTSARRQGRTRFVECNVPIWTNTAHKEVNATI